MCEAEKSKRTYEGYDLERGEHDSNTSSQLSSSYAENGYYQNRCDSSEFDSPLRNVVR